MRIVKYAKKKNVGIKVIVAYLKSIGYQIEHKPTAKLTASMLEDLSKIADWEPLKALDPKNKSRTKQETKDGKDQEQEKPGSDIEKEINHTSWNSSQPFKEQESNKKKSKRSSGFRKFLISSIEFSEGEFKIRSIEKNRKEYVVKDSRIKPVLNEYKVPFIKSLDRATTLEMNVLNDEINEFDYNQKILNWFLEHHLKKTGEDFNRNSQTSSSAKDSVNEEKEKSSANKDTAKDKNVSNKIDKEEPDVRLNNTNSDSRNHTVVVNETENIEQDYEENAPLNDDEGYLSIRNQDGTELKKTNFLESCCQIRTECENERYWPSKSSALLKFITEGNEKVLWIFNSIPIGNIQNQDLAGNHVIHNMGNYNTTVGSMASKNAPSIINILSNIDNRNTFKLLDRTNVTVDQLISYKYHEANPREITIRIPESQDSHSYPKLNDLKELFESFEKDWISLDEIWGTQGQDLQEEGPKKPPYRDIRVIIRDSLELRHENILNSKQNDVKRSHIYNGNTMVIDGGPGTGKTSTLIQRIKLLIENRDHLKEYNKDLTGDQLDRIVEPDNQWLFIAPTPLLADYLKSNLRSEGLDSSSEHLKDWPSYFKTLSVDYGLLSEDDKLPDDTDLFFDQARFSAIGEDFEDKYQEYLINYFTAPLRGGTFNPYHTDSLIEDIESSRGSVEEITSFTMLAIKYDKVHNNFSDPIKYVRQKRDGLKSDIVSTCINNTLSDLSKEKLIYLDSFLDSRNTKSEDPIRDIIERIVLKVAESKFRNRTVKLSKIESEIENIWSIQDQVSNQELLELGEYIFFTKKCYNRFTKSFNKFFFGKIVLFYKENYRNQNSVLESFSTLKNKEKPSSSLKIDELAFLISFINEKVILHKKDANKYFKAYLKHRRVVIAVDEATDLSLFEINCIYSLRDNTVHSVNFCGDLFQRMTERGIDDWDELFETNQNFVRHRLNISYRQSPSLIDLATAIYTEFNNGQKPDYKSHLARYPNEPEPELFIHENATDRKKWLFRYIEDIYEAYSQKLPSTAIFVTQDEKAKELKVFYDSAKETLPYSVKIYEGARKFERDTVYIFNLKDIKGLEFEAVLFYDLDNIIQENISTNRIFYYLYVGLTRAAFYFGVSAEKEFDGSLSFLNDALSNAMK